jgi:hypothetical protein
LLPTLTHTWTATTPVFFLVSKITGSRFSNVMISIAHTFPDRNIQTTVITKNRNNLFMLSIFASIIYSLPWRERTEEREPDRLHINILMRGIIK